MTLPKIVIYQDKFLAVSTNDGNFLEGVMHLKSLISSSSDCSKALWAHTSIGENEILPECRKHFTTAGRKRIARSGKMVAHASMLNVRQDTTSSLRGS